MIMPVLTTKHILVVAHIPRKIYCQQWETLREQRVNSVKVNNKYTRTKLINRFHTLLWWFPLVQICEKLCQL